MSGLHLEDGAPRFALDLARLDPDPDRLPSLPAAFEVPFALHQNGRELPITVRTSGEPLPARTDQRVLLAVAAA